MTTIANYAFQISLPGHIKPAARISSDISEKVMEEVPNFPGALLTGVARETFRKLAWKTIIVTAGSKKCDSYKKRCGTGKKSEKQYAHKKMFFL